jgi:hypothetical protein
LVAVAVHVDRGGPAPPRLCSLVKISFEEFFATATHGSYQEFFSFLLNITRLQVIDRATRYYT